MWKMQTRGNDNIDLVQSPVCLLELFVGSIFLLPLISLLGQFKVLNLKVFSLLPTNRFAVTLVFSLGIAQTIFPADGSLTHILTMLK